MGFVARGTCERLMSLGLGVGSWELGVGQKHHSELESLTFGFALETTTLILDTLVNILGLVAHSPDVFDMSCKVVRLSRPPLHLYHICVP